MHSASNRCVVLLAFVGSMAAACNASSVNDDAGDATRFADGGLDPDGDSRMMDTGSSGYDVTPLPDATLDVPIGGDPLPPFDTATDLHVRDIVNVGRQHLNHPEVFAKIGDSITESGSFLFDCGYGWITLGDHPEISQTIAYFSQYQLGDRNSLNRASECAVAGWSASQALENYPDAPLNHELADARPMFAIIMYGTNDLERYDVATYAGTMSSIVDIVEANGTVAVLSTIPPRHDNDQLAALVPMFNDAIRSLALTRHLPLIDFWVALQSLPNNGIGTDGVHPNVYTDPSDPNTDSCAFTAPALAYGYNVRNLTALQMLARLQPYATAGM